MNPGCHIHTKPSAARALIRGGPNPWVTAGTSVDELALGSPHSTAGRYSPNTVTQPENASIPTKRQKWTRALRVISTLSFCPKDLAVLTWFRPASFVGDARPGVHVAIATPSVAHVSILRARLLTLSKSLLSPVTRLKH